MLYYIFLLFSKTVNLKISIKNIVLIKKLGILVHWLIYLGNY